MTLPVNVTQRIMRTKRQITENIFVRKENTFLQYKGLGCPFQMFYCPGSLTPFYPLMHTYMCVEKPQTQSKIFQIIFVFLHTDSPDMYDTTDITVMTAFCCKVLVVICFVLYKLISRHVRLCNIYLVNLSTEM